MKRHYKQRSENQDALREKIIGLGEDSIHKNYFPELQNRLNELERFRYLSDQSNDLFFICDADSFLITDMSAAHQFCLPTFQPGRIHLEYFFSTETIQALKQFVHEAAQTEHKTIILESEFLSENCPNTPVELAVSIIRKNRECWLVLIARDITERKQNEKKIQNHIERLTILQRVENAITSTLDLNQVLDILQTELKHAMDISDIHVFLIDPITGDLSDILPSKNDSGDTFYFAQLAAKHKTLVQIDDMKIAPQRLGLPQNYFALPLIAKDEVQGVLELFFNNVPSDPDWENFIMTLADQTANAIHNAGLFAEVQRFNLEIKNAYDATLEGWALALELRENETEKHTQRVRELTTRLVRKFGFSEEAIIHIQRGALLHDIGKMGIPDHILLKPGPLDEEEWKKMRMHPTYAIQMLSKIDFLKPALVIPFCHHERWDGSGYPRGLSGTDIPLEARIFAIVDVWDALSSDRPYRKAWPTEKIIQYLKENSGVLFDPEILSVFLSMLEEA